MDGMIMDDHIDKSIKVKAEELETVFPDSFPSKEILWQSLLQRQTQDKARKKIMRWSIAASLLIAIGTSYTFFVSNIHTKERIQTSESIINPTTKKSVALDYIARQCIISVNACNTPAVQELRHDLEISVSNLTEINKQIALYGNDPNLIRARTRIENHQSRVIKTLVQIL
jgi:hypothetical protein